MEQKVEDSGTDGTAKGDGTDGTAKSDGTPKSNDPLVLDRLTTIGECYAAPEGPDSETWTVAEVSTIVVCRGGNPTQFQPYMGYI